MCTNNEEVDRSPNACAIALQNRDWPSRGDRKNRVPSNTACHYKLGRSLRSSKNGTLHRKRGFFIGLPMSLEAIVVVRCRFMIKHRENTRLVQHVVEALSPPSVFHIMNLPLAIASNSKQARTRQLFVSSFHVLKWLPSVRPHLVSLVSVHLPKFDTDIVGPLCHCDVARILTLSSLPPSFFVIVSLLFSSLLSSLSSPLLISSLLFSSLLFRCLASVSVLVVFSLFCCCRCFCCGVAVAGCCCVAVAGCCCVAVAGCCCVAVAGCCCVAVVCFSLFLLIFFVTQANCHVVVRCPLRVASRACELVIIMMMDDDDCLNSF